MYGKNAKVTMWLTLFTDCISLVLAFGVSAFIRKGIVSNGMIADIYMNLFVVVILSTVIIDNLSSNDNFFKRGFLDELRCVVREQGKLGLMMLGYMFAVKESASYSRIFCFIFLFLNLCITYVARGYLKLILLLSYKKSPSSNKVMLVTVSGEVEKVIRHIHSEYKWNIQVKSIALMDKDKIGKRIMGIKVIADASNLINMARLSVVDEVFVYLPGSYDRMMENIILEMEEMGITVHMNLDIFECLNVKQKMIEEFAGFSVITFSSGLFDVRKMLIKRFMDILGGMVGCILTGILTIFLAPVIWIESPGPIFFSQIRIGKNGRKFKIYKFRSMYRDAEAKKTELLELNEMNGLMFKITNDPRITKVGKFIRKTSLDEFPQFWNVLKGDMSLVGTRPPTEDEFKQYESRHKRRLSLKPGLTGLWQVSGRSDIEDFDDVVRLDLEYIDHWSVLYDVKLIVKTVLVVVMGKGSK